MATDQWLIPDDEKTLIFQDGTTHIVWLKGNGPISNVDQLNVHDATEKGMQRTQLLKNPEVQKIKLPKDTRTIEFKADHVHVPNTDTTYWCKVMKLPSYLDRVHHIIQVYKGIGVRYRFQHYSTLS